MQINSAVVRKLLITLIWELHQRVSWENFIYFVTEKYTNIYFCHFRIRITHPLRRQHKKTNNHTLRASQNSDDKNKKKHVNRKLNIRNDIKVSWSHIIRYVCTNRAFLQSFIQPKNGRPIIYNNTNYSRPIFLVN